MLYTSKLLLKVIEKLFRGNNLKKFDLFFSNLILFKSDVCSSILKNLFPKIIKKREYKHAHYELQEQFLTLKKYFYFFATFSFHWNYFRRLLAAIFVFIKCLRARKHFIMKYLGRISLLYQLYNFFKSYKKSHLYLKK